MAYSDRTYVGLGPEWVTAYYVKPSHCNLCGNLKGPILSHCMSPGPRSRLSSVWLDQLFWAFPCRWVIQLNCLYAAATLMFVLSIITLASSSLRMRFYMTHRVSDILKLLVRMEIFSPRPDLNNIFSSSSFLKKSLLLAKFFLVLVITFVIYQLAMVINVSLGFHSTSPFELVIQNFYGHEPKIHQLQMIGDQPSANNITGC